MERESADKRREMHLLDPQGKNLMVVSKLARDGSDLMIGGKIMGAMPMKARLKPSQVRAALKMLDVRLLLFALSLPFRKDAP